MSKKFPDAPYWIQKWHDVHTELPVLRWGNTIIILQVVKTILKRAE